MLLELRQEPIVPEDPQSGILTNSFAEENPLSILIAEDSLINQKLAERILRKLGYSTDIVSDGTQVLDSLRMKDYNVILMDVRMPEMDGIETTQIIRQMAIEQPYIIAMTANSMSEDKAECLNIGMNDYISKLYVPVSLAV
jgi:CheY-like chemotaxis protein